MRLSKQVKELEEEVYRLRVLVSKTQEVVDSFVKVYDFNDPTKLPADRGYHTVTLRALSTLISINAHKS